MESTEVRLARLEEGVVSVKGDTRYLRTQFDHLTWKILSVSGFAAAITSAVITVLLSRALGGIHG